MSRIPKEPNTLESRLRQPQSEIVVPPDLHDSIVSAVRSSRPGPPAPRWPGRFMLLAIVTLATAAFWLMAQPRNHGLPQIPAMALVQETQQSARKAPEFMLSPLTQEMEALSRDFTNATELVRGTLPFDSTL